MLAARAERSSNVFAVHHDLAQRDVGGPGRLAVAVDDRVEAGLHVGRRARRVLAQVTVDEAVEAEARADEPAEEVRRGDVPGRGEVPDELLHVPLVAPRRRGPLLVRSGSRNSASDARSAWTMGMRSAIATPRLGPGSGSLFRSLTKLGAGRTSTPELATLGRRMRDVQRILGALTSPVRREILALIWDRELPAGEIAAAFDVTAPTVSQHLSVLREAGLVTMTARGQLPPLPRPPGRAPEPPRRACRTGRRSGHRPTTSPRRALAHAETRAVVVAQVDVDTDQATTFRGVHRSRRSTHDGWASPCSSDDGRFTCTMEWGTRIDGVYEQVVRAEPDCVAVGLRRRQRARSPAEAWSATYAFSTRPADATSRCTSSSTRPSTPSSSRSRGPWCSDD